MEIIGNFGNFLFEYYTIHSEHRKTLLTCLPRRTYPAGSPSAPPSTTTSWKRPSTRCRWTRATQRYYYIIIVFLVFFLEQVYFNERNGTNVNFLRLSMPKLPCQRWLTELHYPSNNSQVYKADGTPWITFDLETQRRDYEKFSEWIRWRGKNTISDDLSTHF